MEQQQAENEASGGQSRSTVGLERWRFRYTIDNFGPEDLESGKKRCENDGCACAADMIVEGQSSIFFACSQCAHLIPGANVLRSNVRVEGRDAASSRRVPSHDGLASNVTTEK